MGNAEGMRQLVRLSAFPEEDVQREAVWALAILASNQCMHVLFVVSFHSYDMFIHSMQSKN